MKGSTNTSIDSSDVRYGTGNVSSALDFVNSHLAQYVGYVKTESTYTFDFTDAAAGVYIICSFSITIAETRIAVVYKNNGGLGKSWESYEGYVKTLNQNSVEVNCNWYTRHFLMCLCS